MRFVNREMLVAASCLAFLSLWRQTTSGTRVTNGDLQPGVVVEHVSQYSEAEKAGLVEGDIVLRWSRREARGEIQSPFDLAAVEIEQAPRGAVTLEGTHGTESKLWRLGPDTWGIQARPNFSEVVVAAYGQSRDLAIGGHLAEAAARWDAVISLVERSGPAQLRPWFFFRVGQTLAEARRWEQADAALREAAQSGANANPELQTQLLRARADAFKQQSLWTEADRYYQEAVAKEHGAQDSLSLAVDIERLGNAAAERGEVTRAVDYYLQSLHIRENLVPGSLAVASSLNKLCSIEDGRGKLATADDYCRRALAVGNKLAPGGLDVAASLIALGSVALDRGDLSDAQKYYQQALAIQEKLAPDSLSVALAIHNLGRVAARQGSLDKAEAYYRRSLEIRERLAPNSLDFATSLHNLGLVSDDRGDLIQAQKYFDRSFEIRQKLAPGSLQLSYSLNSLANMAGDRGDVAKAENYYRQALEIREKLAPGSTWVAQVLGNLGVLEEDRRDLVKAEEYYRQALEIKQRLSPDSLEVALTLHCLGNVARKRGDLVNAEEYYRRALAIRMKLAPGSLYASISVGSLGQVAQARGDLDKAEKYFREDLAIKEKVAPDSLYLARALDTLGSLYRQRAEIAKAEEYLRRALAIEERVVPRSTDVADSLTSLSEVLKDRGDLEGAEQYGRRALSLWRELAPASADEAEALAGLAAIMRKEGDLDAAAQFYEQAMDALEGQVARLGGTEEVHAGFQAERGSYYQTYVSLLVKQGKADLAFHVVERSRARTLLEMLTSAHVDVNRGADRDLLQRERLLRESLSAKADWRIRLLTGKHTDEQIADLDGEIADLRNDYQAVEAQIRATSPGYAALTQPQPVTAGQLQRLLDADTILLEYSLGARHSYVFAVTRGAVSVAELPSRSVVERLARVVYDSLTTRNHRIKSETPGRQQARWMKADGAFRTLSAQLSRMVLGPVAGEIRGKRLLIVSDGALQYIPFSVLPEPSRVHTPLVAAHEIVNLPSASVLAMLRRQEQEHKPAPKMVAVLADPVFSVHDGRLPANSGPHTPRAAASRSQGGVDKTLVRSVRDVGLDLSRLPFTRREAEAIISLAPPGQSMAALDFEATRAVAASGELSQYRIVHFATHGLVDSRHPDLSGLVLSLVDKHGKSQIGFLSLEDIYNLDLPADLVVLSACETGLGKEINGEGLIGLTRGFMYAGASRVIASLWSVNDAATSELMAKLYRGMLHDDISPAAALRQAQVEMWKSARWKSPYYWAAFQIQGEWQ